MNGAGDILLANDAYKAFAPNSMTTSPEERVEIFFNPDGNGPKLVENWAEVAHGLLDRQRAELAGCYNHRLEKKWFLAWKSFLKMLSGQSLGWRNRHRTFTHFDYWRQTVVNFLDIYEVFACTRSDAERSAR